MPPRLPLILSVSKDAPCSCKHCAAVSSGCQSVGRVRSGAGAPIANGLALAEKLRGTDKVTIVNFGDGATSIGAVHEAMNMAGVWKLPVIFLCQNNQWGEYTRIPTYTASETFAGRADALGFRGVVLDGNDPAAFYTGIASGGIGGVGGFNAASIYSDEARRKKQTELKKELGMDMGFYGEEPWREGDVDHQVSVFGFGQPEVQAMTCMARDGIQ